VGRVRRRDGLPVARVVFEAPLALVRRLQAKADAAQMSRSALIRLHLTRALTEENRTQP
jgi:hypothetical protein